MIIKYEFKDGTISEVEVDDELGEYINLSRREEENYERKTRYHCPVSIDKLEYKGMQFADPDTPMSIYESGCFSVYNLTQRDEVAFYFSRKFSDNIDELKEKSISIESVEKDIWEKHRKTGFLKIPFFWGSNMQVFRALAEVIKTQIEKYGSFFEISVTKCTDNK